jgi:hypothetical protein
MMSGSAGLEVSNGIVQPLMATMGSGALMRGVLSRLSGGESPASGAQGATARAAAVQSDVPKTGSV